VSKAEIARMARELQESAGQFADLHELLGSTLPRLTDPSRDVEFNAAVKALVEQLDESAVHQLSMLVSELWLYWNTSAPPAPTVAVRPLTTAEPLTPGDRSALPAVVEVVVNLAAYAGSAAIGGVIGNRADAILQRMLGGARERWRNRRAAPDTPLTEDEAIEVVHAAAAVHGYDIDDAELLHAATRNDGSWLIRMRVDGETLTTVVPPGDPGKARVIIRVS
jgi:hypothetical protein